MNKLLSANSSRLLKDKVFWLCLSAMFIVSVAEVLNGCRQASSLAQSGYTRGLDDYYFILAPSIGLFYAIFIALFLTTDYSDGTIRNKLVVGHTRTQIFLANFVVCLASGLFMLAAWLIGGLIGIPFLGTWQMGLHGLLIYVAVAIFFTMALTGIFTLISTLSTNKAITVVIAILLYLGLILIASIIYNRLNEPEFINYITLNDVAISKSDLQQGDPIPNPNYITGTVRYLYEAILDFLPSGQTILMSTTEIAHPLRQIIFSLFITLCTVGSGIFAFRKKDIK